MEEDEQDLDLRRDISESWGAVDALVEQHVVTLDLCLEISTTLERQRLGSLVLGGVEPAQILLDFRRKAHQALIAGAHLGTCIHN